MIQMSHVTFRNRQDDRVILSDFSLTLNPGDKCVIVGEEGNGKSSLIKWLYDPALVAGYLDATGARDVRAHRLSYLPQELSPEQADMTVYDYFAADEAFLTADQGDLRRTAARLGFDEALYYDDRPMRTLSGGERVKLMVAAALLPRPDALLLDEPTNDIDLDTLAWMEALIRGFEGIVLYVSHDETLIERTANRVVLIEQLRKKMVPRATVANMPFRRFMDERAAGFEKQAQLAGSERREERKAQERFQRIQQRVEHEQETISRGDPHGARLLKKKMASVKALERRYEREHEQMTDFPEFESGISFRFDEQLAMPARREVLDLAIPRLTDPAGRLLARDVRLNVRGGEKVCLIGHNGAGKTTLLRLILQALREKDGLHVGYMPQRYDDLLDGDMTPIQYLAPRGDKETVTRARTHLGAMKYTHDEMTHPMRALSGGQRAKVLLLGLSLQPTDVLVLDEPTRNLSPLSGPTVRALLRGYQGAVISVSHDRRFIAEVCDKVYELTQEGLLRREDWTGLTDMT